MKSKQIVESWFHCWESGDFESIPVSDDFEHTSPFGTTSGKDNYLELVRRNKDKFLGHRFEILDAMYEAHRACVRYRTSQGDAFGMEVSEWFYLEKERIKRIFSFYHIGEIRTERQLTRLEHTNYPFLNTAFS